LYSAGHANLDTTKFDAKEDMVRNRDPNSFVLGDSGGFQIGKGVWEGEWNDPTGPEVAQRMAEAVAKGIEIIPVLDKSGNPVLDKNGNPKVTRIDHVKLYQAKLDAAQKKREQVLTWMDAYMDRGMILDIPAWVGRMPNGPRATGITSYEDAVNGTLYNNEYFIKNRTGKCKFLNVLQGENHEQADDWYSRMKHFCDTKVYGDKAFNGWAMGGQNMCDVHLVLRRLVALRFDGLLEEGQHDWMHFLGTSKLEWATLLTDIQRAVRKYHNPNFTISFDCASPFLATANGQIYYDIVTPDRGKWSYQMQASVDNKKYASDNRTFRNAVLQDKIFDTFLESPVSERLGISDVCYYKPGDLNKIGKEGKTSWDSFSYTLQMGHNVWTHITAVQYANRQYDAGIIPGMLDSATADKKTTRVYEHRYFRDIVDAIFATNDRAKAEELVEHYNKYWMAVIGTRGATGKKTQNAGTQFNALFDIEETEEEHHIDDSGLDDSKLDDLENNV
jgi:hypothetical protein